MANYVGYGRTNYFRVKDDDAFVEAMSKHSLSVSSCPAEDGERSVCLLGDSESGDWVHYDEDDDDFVDVRDLIADHLVDGETAVFMHIGHEKLRYLCGQAVAVHSDGRRIVLDLDDIYERVKNEFKSTRVTKACY